MVHRRGRDEPGAGTRPAVAEARVERAARFRGRPRAMLESIASTAVHIALRPRPVNCLELAMRRWYVLLPLVLAACASTESGGPVLPGRIDAPPPPLVAAADTQLVGTIWMWQGTQMSDDARFFPDAPERYTLEFQLGGRVNVRADCNRGSGTYVLDGTQLSFGPMALTRAMCPPGSRDGEFLKGLQQASGYLFRGNELVLTLKFDSGSMRFNALR